ncbi:NUDIX hydrolase [Bacillus sp. AFS041924]|uniref:NUDIX hydrolase n=1 Tax=Bacillus sp. AFS041924 TaxID=2033503 RepID=UPI000BFD4FBF|nr:NUDIX hydrolase [Bacillus sp. AFS041924]PGS47953.1 ADP-ribose pyrophosphatase [Bacillus sp. AFS041924]
MSLKWLEWAQKIQAISQAGLTFTKDVYDKERYEELRHISADIMNHYSELQIEEIEGLFRNEHGYPTPKVDVRGVVFKNGKILLVKEKIENKWSLPGGFCDVGLSASENVVKEIFEESGYKVEVKKLLAVLDMTKHAHPPQSYHFYKFFIQCEIIGGNSTTGIETSDIDFFDAEHLPDLSLSRNTASQIKLMFEYNENPLKETCFD